jgi:adenylate cyclase
MLSRTVRLTSVYVMVTVLSASFGMSQAPDTPFGILDGIVTGATIGIAIIVYERLVRDIWARELRRFKPYALAAARFLYYLACFILIPDFVAWLARLIRPDIAAADLAVQRHVLLYFAFALGVNLLMGVRRMLGVRNLWALTLGRYRRPIEEEHVVAFLDLKGSTPLAERLGPAPYHDFLNDVFFDVADAITESGGNVYQYVGDEIVVTWSAKRGIRNADCIAFLFAVEDALAARRDAYLAQYDSAPSLRGALHIGPLMVGEIGDLKRQIVMIGDTMNTAARIEGACRKFGRDYIASVDLLRRVGELPPRVKAESLGLVPLAGKVSELELFALMRE